MPGSFDLDYTAVPLYGDALSVGVYTYAPGAGYSALPNVQLVRIDRREGGEPAAAVFEYILDDAMDVNFGWPSRFEEIFPLTTAYQSPYVCGPDTRVCALAQYPDGSTWLLFDGFAAIPQVELGPRSERVIFTAVETSVRAWDSPISGSVQRGADDTSNAKTDGSADVRTDLRPRFNPSVGSGLLQLENCTSAPTTDQNGNTYPVFTDPDRALKNGAKYWTVDTATQYVLATENGGEVYVQNPDLGSLSTTLLTYQPAAGAPVMSPSDPSSYTTATVRVPDVDPSNQGWPDFVRTLIGYCGFFFRWHQYADSSGNPATALDFYRRDAFAAAAPKSVYLAAAGAALDPSANNAEGIALAIDCNAIANAYQVETGQKLVEISWILRPLYGPVSTDAEAANRPNFRAGNLVQNWENRPMYRKYGADECGDGSYFWAGNAWSELTGLPADFSAIFPPDSDSTPSYVTRYRPAQNTLLATDDQHRPLKADLSISFDYHDGTASGPWDGTGTWQSIQGGWRLLSDRLGIEVIADDPEQWQVGQGGTVGGQAGAELVPGGAIRGITWWAAPPAGAPTNGNPPSLRLTCVIQDDLRMPISHGKRLASPTQFARWRSADRREEYRYGTVHQSSANYAALGGDGTDPVVVRDDTADADALARQLRSAYELPVISGQITIPYITDYYGIGDQVDMIEGRGASLQTCAATAAGEAPRYPWIVAVSQVFQPVQQTILTLSSH